MALDAWRSLIQCVYKSVHVHYVFEALTYHYWLREHKWRIANEHLVLRRSTLFTSGCRSVLCVIQFENDTTLPIIHWHIARHTDGTFCYILANISEWQTLKVSSQCSCYCLSIYWITAKRYSLFRYVKKG